MDTDRMEGFEFSTLHKAVLRLGCRVVEDEIKAHQSHIDGTDKDGNTALQWAAAGGDHQAVRQLLEAGANANSQNHTGASVLHEAVRRSDFYIVQTLLQAGACPSHVESHGYSILHYARGADVGKVIRCLVKADAGVNAEDHTGGSPLKFFVIRQDVEAAKAILELGADLDHLDHDGDSALTESMSRGADDTTELLLSRGANYTTWYSNGCSLLHLAALSGGLRTLDVLLNARLHGIDPDALSHQGQTALQIAQARVFKAEGLVEKLQELLTDIRVRNANLQGPAQANTDEHNHMAIRTSRSLFVQFTRCVGMLQARDVIPRMVQMSLLLALIRLLRYWVYSIFGLDWVAQSLTLAWNMISPDDFMEL